MSKILPRDLFSLSLTKKVNKALFSLGAILALILPASSWSEVERVIVTWTAIECQDACIRQLDKQFNKIPGVTSVSLSPGQVVLKWQKNAPFSFSPINIAMELLGLTINDIRVRVRGRIKHDARHVTLYSLGDYTPFDLINPVVPDMDRQAAQFNLQARALRPALRQKLIDGELAGKIAIIEGPLLMPERSPPIELVVDSLTFIQLEEEAEKPGRR